MTDSMRESLSALVDGEANELELERVLRQIGEDEELRGTWVRYHAVQTLTAGQPVGSLSVDISGRVRQAVAEVEEEGRAAPRWRGFMRPVASFAVAASVASIVVLGGQQLSRVGEVPDAGSQPSLAGGVSPVGLVNGLGATSVRASLGGGQAQPALQPTAGTAYRELARQRMQRYAQEHAEQAALNTPQGLLPYARLQTLQE